MARGDMRGARPVPVGMPEWWPKHRVCRAKRLWLCLRFGFHGFELHGRGAVSGYLRGRRSFDWECGREELHVRMPAWLRRSDLHGHANYHDYDYAHDYDYDHTHDYNYRR